MAYFIAIAIAVFILAYIIFGPARKSRPPEPVGSPERWMDFIPQAQEDQRKAAYPGCRLGLMKCTSTTCDCSGFKPSREFVVVRAHRLAMEEERI